MIQAILTITGGILGAVVLIAAAAAAATKLWRYQIVRAICSPATFATSAVIDAWHDRQRARRISEVNEALGVLFRPNGGASLRDLSVRLGRIEEQMGLPPWRSAHGEEVPGYDEDQNS